MEGLGIAAVFIVFAVVGIGIWVASMSMDKDRITSYIQERGGRVVSINWAPFGKGWFGDKNDRIYEVVYYDHKGDQHWATCKTSMFSGVYWTDDRVTHGKADWYDKLPPRNEAGNPVLRHVPTAEQNEGAENIAAEPLGLSPSNASAPGAVDEEIARLRQRLAELERQRQDEQS